MGIRFRKSINFGPFKATVSKSGISYSAGIAGARVTKRADGRVQATAGLPGTGLYYTETHKVPETSEKPKKKVLPKILIGAVILIIAISIF